MTLVISAYNEAAVMRTKLENALALDYPTERLEIVVISDASTDDTDRIVNGVRQLGVSCSAPTATSVREDWQV